MGERLFYRHTQLMGYQDYLNFIGSKKEMGGFLPTDDGGMIFEGCETVADWFGVINVALSRCRKGSISELALIQLTDGIREAAVEKNDIDSVRVIDEMMASRNSVSFS